MATLAPPPTYAEVVLVEENPPPGQPPRAKFNPIWLKWFLELAQSINDAGGTSLTHNDLGSIQGGSASERYHLTSALATTVGLLAGTTYTPTLTDVANLDASTAYQCQYIRVGAVVFVAGKVDVDPTAGATLTQLGISLPVASNFGAVEDCGGAAFASGIAGQGAAIIADATNDRAEMNWISGDVTNRPMYFTFGYQVI